MKKILKKLNLKYQYKEMPEEIQGLFIKYFIFSVIGLVIVLASIPAFKNLQMTLLLFLAILFFAASVIYHLYLFLSGRIIFMDAAITDKAKTRKDYIISINHEGHIYTVYTSGQKYKNVNIGNPIRIYIHPSNAFRLNMENYTIKYPLHIFQIKNSI